MRISPSNCWGSTWFNQQKRMHTRHTPVQNTSLISFQQCPCTIYEANQLRVEVRVQLAECFRLVAGDSEMDLIGCRATKVFAMEDARISGFTADVGIIMHH